MMMASIWSLLGWKEDPTPPTVKQTLTPPPVTITGIRIPADGAPAHLLSLTTIPVSGNVDSFLFHVPDLRRFWKTEQAWRFRELQRIELVQQRDETCNGIYYAFSSFAMNDLAEHSNIPAWFSGNQRNLYWGDVFLVKVAPHEYGEHAWAAYEDIGPEFLDLLARGPSGLRWP